MTQPTYVVIGNPIAHSKSPQIHALFAAQFPHHPAVEGFLYDRLSAPLDGFVAAVDAFAATGGRGANVTVPFKELAYRLSNPTTRAANAGAVNTLTFNSDGTWSGDNTDGAGLVADILRHAKIEGQRILLLGAGGAARGVILPLLEQKPKFLVVANRTQSKVISIFDALSSLVPPWLVDPAVGDTQFNDKYFSLGFDVQIYGIPVRACGFGQDLDRVVDQVQPFDIIINATSASLSGERLPISNSVFAPNALAYDMMYGKTETPFLAQAREAGVELRVDGLGMLVGQAAEAFELWTGLRPDVAPVLQWMREQL